MALCKNYDEVLSLLQAAGLEIEGPLQIGTSKMVRCYMDGDRKKKRGAYRLFETPLSNGDTVILGTFGYAKGAEYHFDKIPFPKGERKSVDAQQMAAIRERMVLEAKRAEAERLKRGEEAAAQASTWWGKLSDNGACAYLERKGLPPGKLYGARVSESGNLVVPMQDGDGKVWGLQVIYGDPAIKAKKGRDKDFTPPGLIKKGHWFQIGSPIAGGIVLLCEGFATGASLHEATGLPVVVAFDAGSLLPVASAIRKRYRGVRVLVCADDDYMTDPNTGVQAAQAAALAIDGAYVVPSFPVERSTDKAKKGPTDFNDLHVLPEGGLHAVRAQIDAAIASAEWVSSAATARRAAPQRGEGSKPGERPTAVSTLSLAQIVERFIHVDDSTGEFAFDLWTQEMVKKSKIVGMLPARVRWDDVKDHPTWQSRAVYIDEIGFDPTGADSSIKLNKWKGWPTQPREGKCDLLLDLLRYLCCNEGNGDEIYRWMLCWLAYPLQHTGAKMQSAVVVHGPQGTGKSRFFEAYAKIYGKHAVVLTQSALEDKFNSDWGQKLFGVADEVVARGEMHHIKNYLKNLITSETIRINPKNLPAYTEKNHINLVFLSNEKQPIVLENDDRRHLVIWTPAKLSEGFYDEVAAEIDAGGIEALHHYLLHLDLGGFKPWTRPPMTRAKAQLIDTNRESVDRFLLDWQAGDIDGLPFCPCGSSDLYTAYMQWARREGVRFPRESNQFAGHIEKLPGWVKGHKDRYGDTYYTGKPVRQRFVIPAADALAAAALRDPATNYTQRPDETQTQWLTRCYFAFRAATQGGQP